jgi:hypothetical protein
MRVASLRRDRAERQQVFAPRATDYDFFTEGFDPLDLKQAKVPLGAPAP